MAHTQWKKELKKIYSTPGESGAFSSVSKLHDILKVRGFVDVTLKQVQNWLNDTYTYAIHRTRPVTFNRNVIVAEFIDHNWQADILFLADLATFNDKKPCILVCIDVISRYAWAEPMPSKKGKDTAKAFQAILNRSAPRHPVKLQTDKGTEFYNKDFKDVLKKYDITLYSTESDKKAAIAERFIKELKKLIYRYMSTYTTNRYIDKLEDLVHTYNTTMHTSIGMQPNEVSEETVKDVLENLYSHFWKSDKVPIPSAKNKNVTSTKVRFQIGDKVRISLSRDFFTKGYKGYWSSEIFTIDKIKKYHPHLMYSLRDADDEILKGLFYGNELQLAKPKSRRFARIQHIFKRKYIKGKLWYLVNWENENPKSKRWIPAQYIK